MPVKSPFILHFTIWVVAFAGVLMGCSALGSPGVPTPNIDHTGTSTTAPATPATNDAIALSACSAILDTIPMVVVQSGRPTLAAAYQATGDQLATYLEARYAQTGMVDTPSVWRQEPSQIVDMCLFDGDFMTQTPGPPGHDTSAVRVLVVISDGDALLWAIERTDPSKLPNIDPKTM